MAKHGSNKWHTERRMGIGGSDVHHVFSLAPFGCARRLFFEKKGPVLAPPDYPVGYSPAMERGKALESVAVKEYRKLIGPDIKVFNEKESRGTYKRRFSDEQGYFMRGEIDRKLWDEDGKRFGVLEIKVSGRDAYYKYKEEGLPEAYILQMQHYLLITNFYWGEFYIFCPDQWEGERFKVQPDEKLQKVIIEAECDFWYNNVMLGVEPDRLELGEEHKRCSKCLWRVTCWADLVDVIEQGAVSATEDISEMPEVISSIQNLVNMKSQVAHYEKEVVKGKAKIADHFRDIFKDPLKGGERKQSIKSTDHVVTRTMVKGRKDYVMTDLLAGVGNLPGGPELLKKCSKAGVPYPKLSVDPVKKKEE